MNDKISEQALPLQGGRNFRDLGGYKTRSGQRVRSGHIYRSGSLSALTDEDYEALSERGIETIVDLRSNKEREKEPTNWRAGDVEFLDQDYEHLDNLAKNDTWMDQLRAHDATEQTAITGMSNFYRVAPYMFAPIYSQIFERLVKMDTPLLFHCAAGKDRTGVMAALILTVLEVPRETIFEDYLLTDRLLDFVAEYETGQERQIAPNVPQGAFKDLPVHIVAPVFRSDPRYLEAAFDQIETDFGHVDGYLEIKLGVDGPARQRLHDRLLSD